MTSFGSQTVECQGQGERNL